MISLINEVNSTSLESLKSVLQIYYKIPIEDHFFMKNSPPNSEVPVYIIRLEKKIPTIIFVGEFIKTDSIAHFFNLLAVYSVEYSKYTLFKKPKKIIFLLNNIDKPWVYVYLTQNTVNKYLNIQRQDDSAPSPKQDDSAPSPKKRKHSLDFGQDLSGYDTDGTEFDFADSFQEEEINLEEIIEKDNQIFKSKYFKYKKKYLEAKKLLGF